MPAPTTRSQADHRLGGVMALGLSLALLATPAAAHSLKGLEDALFKRERYVEIVNRPAPDFTLEDADGRPVRLANFKGRVVVLYFIYASCPDVCPLHSAAIAGIQRAINPTPMKDLIQFIAVTTDPVRDTPAVMRSYGATHGLDDANWKFLTSSTDKPDATRKIAELYGLKFTPGDGGHLMHGVVTHLIDKSGNLRARYHGLKFNPTNMIVHINALTNDYH